jgi:hypothetical protein
MNQGIEFEQLVSLFKQAHLEMHRRNWSDSVGPIDVKLADELLTVGIAFYCHMPPC